MVFSAPFLVLYLVITSIFQNMNLSSTPVYMVMNNRNLGKYLVVFSEGLSVKLNGGFYLLA